MALVDDEDFCQLNQNKWHLQTGHGLVKNVYASRHCYLGKVNKKTKQKTLLMHREILGVITGQVDHIDGNGLNNCKSNLRVCTTQQNSYNKDIQSKNIHGYKGVKKNSNRWVARISANNALKHIGSYKTKEEAALAYNEAALKYHGEFAKLNIL